MEKRTKTNEKKKMAGSLSNGPFLTSMSTEAQKTQQFHKRKSSSPQLELLDDFLRVLASARTTQKTQKQRKRR